MKTGWGSRGALVLGTEHLCIDAWWHDLQIEGWPAADAVRDRRVRRVVAGPWVISDSEEKAQSQPLCTLVVVVRRADACPV